MPILKPALCAAAIAVAAAIAIPAIAQQSPGNAPAAGQAAPGPDNDGRGPGWRGGPRERYSDDEGRGPRWRRGFDERRFGRGDDEGPRGWDRRRFGGEGDGEHMRGGGMRRFGMARMCGPDGGRAGQAMVERLERATQPTAEQRANFDKLKEASAKASEIMRAACPTERSITPTGRLAAAEKRLTAMLDAVRTVRPAMDAYYGQLSDEQKARLTLAQPRMGRGMGGFHGGEGFRDGDGFRGGEGGRERGRDDRRGSAPQQQLDQSDTL